MYNDLFRIVYLLSVLSQLADCYLSAGEAAGAIKIYEECVETFRKHLPDTLLNLCTGESENFWIYSMYVVRSVVV